MWVLGKWWKTLTPIRNILGYGDLNRHLISHELHKSENRIIVYWISTIANMAISLFYTLHMAERHFCISLLNIDSQLHKKSLHKRHPTQYLHKFHRPLGLNDILYRAKYLHSCRQYYFFAVNYSFHFVRVRLILGCRCINVNFCLWMGMGILMVVTSKSLSRILTEILNVAVIYISIYFFLFERKVLNSQVY